MPKIDPSEYKALALEGSGLVSGFALHDVWLVELEASTSSSTSCTIQELRNLVSSKPRNSLSPLVRALFSIRSVLGRIFRLDSVPKNNSDEALLEKVPQHLVNDSLISPGTQDGPFMILYSLPFEAAYHIRNATVEAVLIIILTKSISGHRFFWATYIKPVGRITSIYMWIIDPFRRAIVYPGLELWLKRVWLEKCREVALRC